MEIQTARIQGWQTWQNSRIDTVETSMDIEQPDANKDLGEHSENREAVRLTKREHSEIEKQSNWQRGNIQK